LRDESSPGAIAPIGTMLFHIAGTSDADAVRATAKQLALKLPEEPAHRYLSALFEALTSMKAYLDDQARNRLMAALVKRLPSEQDPFAADLFVRAIVEMSHDSPAQEKHVAARYLAAHLPAERAPYRFQPLKEAFTHLIPTLAPDDRHFLAASLLQAAQSNEGAGCAGLLIQVRTQLRSDEILALEALLKQRLRRTRSPYEMLNLAQMLSDIGDTATLNELRPAIAQLTEFIGEQNTFGQVESLTRTWVALERIVDANSELHERVRKYREMLRLPLVVNSSQQVLLGGLEDITGQKFYGDLWRFVESAG